MVEIYSSNEIQVVPKVLHVPQDPHVVVTQDHLQLPGHRLDNLDSGDHGEIANIPVQCSKTTPLVDTTSNPFFDNSCQLGEDSDDSTIILFGQNSILFMFW